MYRKCRPTNILANALHILYYAMEDDCTGIRYAPEQSKLIYEIHVQYMKYNSTFFLMNMCYAAFLLVSINTVKLSDLK